MPDFAFLEATVSCPICENEIDRLQAFSWGYVYTHQPGVTPTYHVGDQIQWGSVEGRVPAHGAFVSLGGSFLGGNAGDPSIKFARLSGGSYLEWGSPPSCSHCNTDYGGVEVNIEEGRIASVRALPLAQMDTAGAVWTHDKRAGWVSRLDWSIHRALVVEHDGPIDVVTEVDDSQVDRKLGMVETRIIREDGYAGIPRYAFLDAEFECPLCHGGSRLLPAFWWGYVCDLRYDMEHGTPATYHIGDPIGGGSRAEPRPPGRASRMAWASTLAAPTLGTLS